MKVVFVCLGNICRSPMAEAVFRQMVKDRGLEQQVIIDSAATSSWEQGNPVHSGTRKQLAKVHFKAKFLWDNGATEEQMKPTLALIRKSQWRWDMVHSSHGAAFHAPIESERLLSDGLIYAYQAENNLDVLKEKLNIKTAFVMPDISTKAKAQKEIGLDIPKEEAAKKKFLETIVPKWIKEAKEKGRLVTQK